MSTNIGKSREAATGWGSPAYDPQATLFNGDNEPDGYAVRFSLSAVSLPNSSDSFSDGASPLRLWEQMGYYYSNSNAKKDQPTQYFHALSKDFSKPYSGK